jgi:hypothetical protein
MKTRYFFSGEYTMYKFFAVLSILFAFIMLIMVISARPEDSGHIALIGIPCGLCSAGFAIASGLMSIADRNN